MACVPDHLSYYRILKNKRALWKWHLEPEGRKEMGRVRNTVVASSFSTNTSLQRGEKMRRKAVQLERAWLSAEICLKYNCSDEGTVISLQRVAEPLSVLISPSVEILCGTLRSEGDISLNPPFLKSVRIVVSENSSKAGMLCGGDVRGVWVHNLILEDWTNPEAEMVTGRAAENSLSAH